MREDHFFVVYSASLEYVLYFSFDRYLMLRLENTK